MTEKFNWEVKIIKQWLMKRDLFFYCIISTSQTLSVCNVESKKGALTQIKYWNHSSYNLSLIIVLNELLSNCSKFNLFLVWLRSSWDQKYCSIAEESKGIDWNSFSYFLIFWKLFISNKITNISTNSYWLDCCTNAGTNCHQEIVHLFFLC